VKNKKIDYVYLNSVKKLLRENEQVFLLLKTKTRCRHLTNKLAGVLYYIIATRYRIILVAKDKNDEYSMSFGYNEIGSIRVNRGMYSDIIRIHSETLKLSRRSTNYLFELSQFVNFKVTRWKYPVYIILFLILFVLLYHGFLYFRDIWPGNILRLFDKSGKFHSGGLTQAEAERLNNATNASNRSAVLSNEELEKKLKSVLEGYQYSIALLEKNFPMFIKNPSLTGNPSSKFDEWASRELLPALNAQDARLDSLSVSSERHATFKRNLYEIHDMLVLYLDKCKKSFTAKEIKKELEPLKNGIIKKISLLKSMN